MDIGQLQDMTLREIEKQYRADVEDIAEEALEETKDEDSKHLRDEAISEFVWESVDSDQWIIYTYPAQLVPTISENRDAWQDMGFDKPTEAQIAYCAMEQDVMEAVERLRE